MPQKKIKTPLNDVLLVGFDFTHEVNQSILIVGKRTGRLPTSLTLFKAKTQRLYMICL